MISSNTSCACRDERPISDLFAPISGKVTRINEALEDTPELVNDDCWGKGWMVAIEPSGPGELLDGAAYRKFLEESDH